MVELSWFVGFVVAFVIFVSYAVNQIVSARRRIEALETELDRLKNRLNPH